MSADLEKKAAGFAAAALVETGTVVGLGTGSTAAHFVTALADRVKVVCVPTSVATENLARSLGLDVRGLDAVESLDLTVDGADEIGPGLSLIKGGGAALLREKLVWEASRRCVVIADNAKDVAHLGRFALPVEVVAFGHEHSARRVKLVALSAGVVVEPKLRLKDGGVVTTDTGRRIRRRQGGAPCGPDRRQGRHSRGISGRRHLRHPGLRAQEVHGLRLGLSRRSGHGQGLWLGSQHRRL